MIHKWGYTNFHDINLDWILTKVLALDDKVNNKIDDIINDYVDTHMSKFMIKAMYDETNTSINFIGYIDGGVNND